MKEATPAIKRRIAMYIVCAQVASDAGKGKIDTCLSEYLGQTKMVRQAQLAGYAMKDAYIHKACQLISSTKNTGFRFRCTDGGCTASLFYFETRINGNIYQVSFHNLDDNQVWKDASRKCDIHWDHGDSRKSCVEIARAFAI